MKKFIFIFLILLISFVTAVVEVGDLESSIDGVVIQQPEVILFNNDTGSVNSSNFWDALDTPADFLLSMFDGPNWVDTDLDLRWQDLLQIDEMWANTGYFTSVVVTSLEVEDWSNLTDTLNQSFVPYIGATDNVDLEDYNITANRGLFEWLNISGTILTGTGNIYSEEGSVSIPDTLDMQDNDIQNIVNLMTENLQVKLSNGPGTIPYTDAEGNFLWDDEAMEYDGTYFWVNDVMRIGAGVISTTEGQINFMENNLYNVTNLTATNLNITGTANIGDLTWNGNLDLGGNNLTNADWINGFNQINGSGNITTGGFFETRSGINLDYVGAPIEPTLELIAEAGNVDNGEHHYFVTAYTALGETSATADSGAPSVTTDAGHGKVTVTIPVIDDYRVVGRRIYRTKADQSYYKCYHLADVENNVDTEYIDNISDASLTGTETEGFYRADTTNSVFLVDGVAAAVLSDKATMFGVGAKAGVSGVAIGQNAGKTLTTGTLNTLIGSGTGDQLTTGNSNTFIGDNAGGYTTGGIYGSTGIGRNALYKGGIYNVGVGSNAGTYSTGAYNTYVGTGAGSGPSTGTVNFEKSVIVGYRAGYVLTTGDNNILIGYQAGNELTTGADNIIIGYDIDASAVGVSNELNIGGAIIGDLETGSVNVTGNFSGNQFYGEMWYHNHIATQLTFATQYTNYTLWLDEAEELNGFSHETISGVGSNLTAQVGGLYSANWFATGDGQNNHIYVGSIYVNDVSISKCEDHKKMASGGDITSLDGSCFVRLSIGDVVDLRVGDWSGTGTGNYFGGNLNLVRIGT